jgi:hypothetical protein
VELAGVGARPYPDLEQVRLWLLGPPLMRVTLRGPDPVVILVVFEGVGDAVYEVRHARPYFA